MAAEAMQRLRAVLPRGGSLSEEAWASRHRGITVLAWLHVPVLLLVATLRDHLTAGYLGGVALVALLALAGAGPWSQGVRASAVTLSMLTSTALLIELFDGLIEIHFHFFVVVAVVAMYQLWTPYLLALAFVLAHHAVMGTMMPMMVYNHPAAIAHPVLFSMIHAGFVLAESVACLTYWKITEAAADSERAQRVRAEEMGEHLAQANREISDLLAMMSHDLRTPLMVVTGYASMALESWDELDDHTLRDFVQRMEAAGHSLEEMLDSTLTVSADDAAGLHSRPVAVRVDEAVRAVVAPQAAQFTHVDLSELGSVVALVDKGQLTQIVSNLLTNAAKYGAAPYAVSAAADGDEVSIVVSDSGKGVPAAFVPRLFDRYARADEARRGSQKGTGLGLYIVRRLAEANGGTVRYATSERGGATFVVTLPRAPRLALPVNAGTSHRDSGPSTGRAVEAAGS